MPGLKVGILIVIVVLFGVAGGLLGLVIEARSKKPDRRLIFQGTTLNEANEPGRRPMTIRGLLVFTVLFALSLTLTIAAIPTEDYMSLDHMLLLLIAPPMTIGLVGWGIGFAISGTLRAGIKGAIIAISLAGLCFLRLLL